ncbi:hypothetical protein H5410_000576 [Solanum commersonii]|uniref:Uncharacterized protein n=1 Tax=Solanum commersonii TaxID=4109 RepID=A0A9J6AXB5_SOLCO|nr:hypothetical protein H5410_000576 [Solanum commersonii]
MDSLHMFKSEISSILAPEGMLMPAKPTMTAAAPSWWDKIHLPSMWKDIQPKVTSSCTSCDGVILFTANLKSGVPQATTPFGLDQEEEEGDSSIISWQAVLMGYGCGLVIGLSIIYIMLSTQYPALFSRMNVELEHKILKRIKRHKKRN